MLQRVEIWIATTALAVALAALPASPAWAQLSLTIDPTQGFSGDTVSGQVDPAGVAASCVTDLAELQARFEAVIAGPFNGGATEGEFFSRFFPGGDFLFETCEQSAYSLTGITILGIALNVNGAAETVLPQTFVLTFADLAIQQPVGELGHFDPVTGAGSVTVPDITPGLWAVAATCVGPVLDLDALEAGIRSNGAFLESLGMPCDINSPEFEEFLEEFLGGEGDIFQFLEIIGPTLIQSIVAPNALGVQLFTILAEARSGRAPGARRRRMRRSRRSSRSARSSAVTLRSGRRAAPSSTAASSSSETEHARRTGCVAPPRPAACGRGRQGAFRRAAWARAPAPRRAAGAAIPRAGRA